MTVTAGARFGLTNWGAGTDKPTRTQANNDHGLVETKGAIRIEAPLASRPAAGMGGVLFLATDTHVAYWDNGVGWEVIGRVVEGTRTVKLTAGQNTNLDEYRDASGTLLSYVDSAAVFHGGYTDNRSPAWTRLNTTFQANWSEGSPTNNPMQLRRVGDFCSIVGILKCTVANFYADALSIPAGLTALLPKYSVHTACMGWISNIGQAWISAAVLGGSTDVANGLVGAGNLRIFGATNNGAQWPANSLFLINLNWQIGG